MCGDCVIACRANAIDLTKGDRINRTQCNACGKCAEVCPGMALRRIGKYYEPDELVNELLRDRTFYQVSGGGVTFSGGEPTLHMDYLSTVAGLLKAKRIHIAMQTAGYFDLKSFVGSLLPYLDFIYYDIKFMDAEEHKRWTGKDNKIILSNFLELTKLNPGKLMPRVPLVPGITATEENLTQIACFIQAAGYNRYELLAYNSAGRAKLPALGKPVLDAVEHLYWEENHYDKYREIFAGCLSPAQDGSGRQPSYGLSP